MVDIWVKLSALLDHTSPRYAAITGGLEDLSRRLLEALLISFTISPTRLQDSCIGRYPLVH